MLCVQFPLGITLFFQDASILILYKIVRNVRFVLFTKTSIKTHHFLAPDPVPCTVYEPLEFFLNGEELLLNSVNSGNLKITVAWIRLNLKILSYTCVLLVLEKHTGLLHKRWQVRAVLMTNIFCHPPNSANSLKYLGKTPLHWAVNVQSVNNREQTASQ